MSSGYGYGPGGGSGGAYNGGYNNGYNNASSTSRGPSQGFTGYGQGYGGDYAGGFRTQGDIDPRHLSTHPTAMEALESAVALPKVFTTAEMQRTLRRNHGDVMKTALQLRDKHAFRQHFHYTELNIGLNTIQLELKKGYIHFLEQANDRQCPILLLLLQHFKPHFRGEKTQLQGMGTMDGTSSLDDTRRVCVYMMDVAVEAMEENGANGIIFLIDMENWQATTNLMETELVTDILTMLKTRYPEVVHSILILNATTIQRAFLSVLFKAVSERTQQRIKILNPSELRQYLPPISIPSMLKGTGGSYRLVPPIEWMQVQAEIEQVDLTATSPAPAEQAFMTKEARQLNGMQYAACSVDQVVEMRTSVIRGPLYRNKSGMAWVKLYGILRPEALLLYETVTSSMPMLIIPVNEETTVHAAVFADAPRGSFGFRIDVPGVAGGHLLAACSEVERGNWLQEIQMNLSAIHEEQRHLQYVEQQQEDERRRFAKLNMISFDVEEETVRKPVPVPVSPSVLPQHTFQGNMGGMMGGMIPQQGMMGGMTSPQGMMGGMMMPQMIPQQGMMGGMMQQQGMMGGMMQQQGMMMSPPSPVSPLMQMNQGMMMQGQPLRSPPSQGMMQSNGMPLLPMSHHAGIQSPQQQQQQYYQG